LWKLREDKRPINPWAECPLPDALKARFRRPVRDRLRPQLRRLGHLLGELAETASQSRASWRRADVGLLHVGARADAAVALDRRRGSRGIIIPTRKSHRLSWAMVASSASGANSSRRAVARRRDLGGRVGTDQGFDGRARRYRRYREAGESPIPAAHRNSKSPRDDSDISALPPPDTATVVAPG
jgi:hypothetical protein